MSIYGITKEFKKSDKFEQEARKLFIEALGEEPVHRQWIQFNNAIGDIRIRQGGKTGLEAGLSAYTEANRNLIEMVGQDNIHFYLSLADIGDIHMEKSEYEKATSFYSVVKSKIRAKYGKTCIF